MIKGINKHIIEIIDINNPHFYKAILFVRPESEECELCEIEEDARALLNEGDSIAEIAPAGFLRKREKHKKRLTLALILSCAAVLLGTALLIFL